MCWKEYQTWTRYVLVGDGDGDGDSDGDGDLGIS